MKNQFDLRNYPASFPDGFTPMFKIYKPEAHPNGPVTILKKDGEPFDIEAKKAFYQMLGHQILPL